MFSTENPEIVVFHYSETYRSIASEVAQRAGYSALLFDKQEAAIAALQPYTSGIVVPYEQFVLNDEGGLTTLQPSDALIDHANLFGVPWFVIVGPRLGVPKELFNRSGLAADKSFVVSTGEDIATSVSERIALSLAPDEATQKRIGSAMLHWMQMIKNNRQL